jgi:dynein heavy chain
MNKIYFFPISRALTNFESLQKDTEYSNRQVLHMQWREDIKNDIQDTLHDKYRFYQTETKQYTDSSLQRLLRRFDFMFNVYLRTNVVKLQIAKWCIFLKNFTVPEEKDQNIWRINDYPLIVLNMSIKDKKKQKKNDRHRNTQTPAPGQTFQDWNEDTLFYEPSYQTVISTLTKPFEWLIETTNSFLILEKDLVPLIDIEKKVAFEISKDLEEIKEGTKKIVDYVSEGFKEPNEILDQFKKYQFLLDKTPKEIIKQYFGDGKDISIINLDKEAVERGLKEYSQAKLEVQRLCINEKNCRFFQVRTQACKEGLVNRANELIKSIL